MRELVVTWIGKKRRRGFEDLCAEYRRRIEQLQVPVRDQQIKVRERGEDHARRRAEAAALRAALPDPALTVALCPRAKALTSEAFAVRLARWREEFPHPVVFLIGSDLGLDPELRAAARQRLSFGPMTFGHELARLVLYEQIYRALCIGRGIKYHRQAF